MEGKDEPCEGERVPLEIGNLGAGQEDILSSTSCCLVLLDLNLHNV